MSEWLEGFALLETLDVRKSISDLLRADILNALRHGNYSRAAIEALYRQSVHRALGHTHF